MTNRKTTDLSKYPIAASSAGFSCICLQYKSIGNQRVWVHILWQLPYNYLFRPMARGRVPEIWLNPQN